MTETLLALLVGHFVGDFVLQTDRMVRIKRAPAILVLHVVLVTAVSALLLGSLDGWGLGILFLTHLAMDAVKVYLLPPSLPAFLADQAVHLAVIVALALAFPATAQAGLWGEWLTDAEMRGYAQGMAGALGVLLTLPVAGVVIGLLMEPLTRELEGDQSPTGGLPNGGRYIGWLERGLVLMLYLGGQSSAIGFVLATKSILRFGEIKDSEHRKLAEFILIGTFLSFALALAGGILTEWALGAVASP
ncbi:DUF3307 domain-containing protein [Thiohalorhabdus denitrificans]|uniref:DUF3307 domain-containing protein n=1 Tax=Thiohalorhabdus denitrificans TaxID=381306 RepID=A0A1G5E7N2_9GAMM|nr:DUF3307 domain-containing protein [Thiohalorhabdus denitrificans]SCY22700.1 Protein of unknown function [Thiohalorhabdus denitrificans]